MGEEEEGGSVKVRSDSDDLYILDGHTPVKCEDLVTWALWFQDHERQCVVALDVHSTWYISTRFLGLNMDVLAIIRRTPCPPLVFETMAFTKAPLNIEVLAQDRYSTWGEAEAGHKLIKARLLRAVSS